MLIDNTATMPPPGPLNPRECHFYLAKGCHLYIALTLVRHESGVTAIEYSLIAALIAVAAISALQNVDFVMPPDMVYQYPLWGVGLLLVGLVILGVVVFDLAAHQFLSVEFRRRHNDAAAALFSMMGVTFAVLLAFVAMLSWDGYK